MTTTVIATIHILVALVLIVFVLLQDSKGGGIFGGGTSNTVFGATGGTTFLVKLTRAGALIFAITSLALTILTSRKSVVDTGVMPAVPMTAPATTTPPEAAKTESQPATSEKSGSKSESTTNP